MLFIHFWIFEDRGSLLVSVFPYASHTVLTLYYSLPESFDYILQLHVEDQDLFNYNLRSFRFV